MYALWFDKDAWLPSVGRLVCGKSLLAMVPSLDGVCVYTVNVVMPICNMRNEI